MLETKPGLMDAVRDRFAHVDACPFQGSRVFFENAGGALTLKSVAETSARFAAIPDNQGRANVASQALVKVITDAKADMMRFFNAKQGQAFVGESGTELLFRVVRAAVLGSAEGGHVLGSTLEHPASRSAAIRWAEVAGKPYVSMAHDDATGLITAEDYKAKVTPETRVATIIHTSPVTGMGMNLAAIASSIRAVSPDCFIIVDGIQHAAHGPVDVDQIDAYVISPYKAFSRHGYGVAWISDRLSKLPHDVLLDAPAEGWELGTRDTGSYATFSDVVRYFEWLGSNFTDSKDSRDQLEAAGEAIHAHEKDLCQAMLFGTGNQKGLSELPRVHVIGGVDNAAREGLVSLWIDGLDCPDLVEKLNEQGIRTHVRKADHYSGTVLRPLGRETCVRVSMCHYNTQAEVAAFLAVMNDLAA